MQVLRAGVYYRIHLLLFLFSLSWPYSYYYVLNSGKLRVSGPFLESPENVSGLKSCFMFVVFEFKIKVSITLKMIQWQYQLTTQNWPVCDLGLNCAATNSTGLDFKIFLDPKSYRTLTFDWKLESAGNLIHDKRFLKSVDSESFELVWKL